MNIDIVYGSRTPIYEQIVSEVEKLITLGVLKPDEQIPSIRDLACSLGINPNTVKKAYDILENKGIIISKSTKGTFISRDISKAKEIKIKSLTEDINKLIKELVSYGLSKEEIIAKLKD